MPLGISDGGILEALDKQTDEDGNFFGWIVSEIVKAIKSVVNLFGVIQDVDKNKVPDEATGKAYLDSSETQEDWEKFYKYAQRYISLSRAAQDMRMFDGDETAYNYDYFGTEDVVAKYLREKHPEYQDIIAQYNYNN